MSNKTFADYEKCANYSVLASIVATSISTMGRFKNVPKEKVITTIYSKLKDRAAK